MDEIKNGMLINLSGCMSRYKKSEMHLMMQKIVSSNSTEVLIDISKVDFIDTSFLKMLILFTDMMKDHGRSVCLINPSWKLMRIMRETGLLSRLPVSEAPVDISVADHKELSALPAA